MHKPYTAKTNHLTNLNTTNLKRTDIVDEDGWPIGHLCMRVHPTEPGIFCRNVAGHDGKCAPAMSDVRKRNGATMPGTEDT